jgi:RNA-directed DNA polymerase
MINLFETTLKTVPITKVMVKEAYRKVSSNKGSGGVDKISLEEFQKDLLPNLYLIWNRLSSGSYFPKPVREVLIPKANGSKRSLGIPTVGDRIAQQVIKTYLEPRLEKVFHESSYGYRPLKSAHDALDTVQLNVRKYAWVIDEVSHELLMQALECHVEERWVKMYIKRWLESPIQKPDGILKAKEGQGTPQGGVISPLLSNLFLHYVLDKWLMKHYPHIAFVRYADDVLIHCNTELETKDMLKAIRERLKECKLGLNEEKTKIIYCQDGLRKKEEWYEKKFDFLGYTFKPQTRYSTTKKKWLGFGCAISQKSQTRIVEVWKHQAFHRRTTLHIQDIATMINPQLRGVIRYYGKHGKWSLQPLIKRFHYRLAKWVLKKYKSLKGSFKKAYKWINEIKISYPSMFYHWTLFKHI